MNNDELATLTWVDWYNNRRLLERLGHIPLVEAEGNDSNLLIVFYVQIMPDDLVMQLHRF